MRRWRPSPAITALAIALAPCSAQAFNSVVSPPYFDLKAKPGAVLRESLTLTNLESTPARFSVMTGDWDITEQGQVVFLEGKPRPGSCRPWVRIERREITVPGRLSRPFRLEVEVPADTKLSHCHFAVFFEGLAEAAPPFKPADDKASAGFSIAGRLAVVVYVTIGDAGPRFEIRGFGTEQVGERVYPLVTIYNAGDAYGRPSGILQARDTTGQTFEMVVEQVPVLPGHSRPVRILPDDPAAPMPPLRYFLPLQLKGAIEWRGGKTEIDTTIR